MGKGYYIAAEEAEVLYRAEEVSMKKDLHYLAEKIGGVPVSKEAIEYTIDKLRYNLSLKCAHSSRQENFARSV